MRFRLRTLLILLAVGPMVLALAWQRGEPLFWRHVWPHPELNTLPPGKTIWIDPPTGRWNVADKIDDGCSQINY